MARVHGAEDGESTPDTCPCPSSPARAPGHTRRDGHGAAGTVCPQETSRQALHGVGEFTHSLAFPETVFPEIIGFSGID